MTDANINQAIQACREERGQVLQNRQEMRAVKESVEDGYCDVSGKVGNLVYVGRSFSQLPSVPI